MKDEGLRKAIDFLVINTDGWVLGEEAVQYKLRLTRHIVPSLVVGIQQQDELTPLLKVLKGIKVISIDSPPAIKKRDREKRKILRELSYKKYLKEAKVQSFSLSKVKSGDFSFGKGATPDDQRLEKVRTKLGVNPLYCEETPNSIVIVSGKNQQVDEEQIINLEEELGKKVNLMREGEEQGLLVGLHDEEEKFMGIGILSKIDYERHIIQVYTPVTANVASIMVGQVKLDRQGREIGVSPVKPFLI